MSFRYSNTFCFAHKKLDKWLRLRFLIPIASFFKFNYYLLTLANPHKKTARFDRWFRKSVEFDFCEWRVYVTQRIYTFEMLVLPSVKRGLINKTHRIQNIFLFLKPIQNTMTVIKMCASSHVMPQYNKKDKISERKWNYVPIDVSIHNNLCACCQYNFFPNIYVKLWKTNSLTLKNEAFKNDDIPTWSVTHTTIKLNNDLRFPIKKWKLVLCCNIHTHAYTKRDRDYPS